VERGEHLHNALAKKHDDLQQNHESVATTVRGTFDRVLRLTEKVDGLLAAIHSLDSGLTVQRKRGDTLEAAMKNALGAIAHMQDGKPVEDAWEDRGYTSGGKSFTGNPTDQPEWTAVFHPAPTAGTITHVLMVGDDGVLRLLPIDQP
jgi:hypothetical protein